MALLMMISSLLLLGFCCTLSNAATAISDANKAVIVGLHNAQRAAVGASNMLYMVWNDTLATKAGLVLDQQATASLTGDCHIDSIYLDSTLGVNFITFPSNKANLTAAVLTWMQSKANYTFTNDSCGDNSDPAACESYLQIVYSEGNQIGCDYRNCTAASPPGPPQTTLVCYYSPMIDRLAVPPQKPFLKGKPCTKCSTGTFTCTVSSTPGLCDQGCTSKTSCVCKADCKNCGKAVTTTCSCQCPNGRTGVDCSGPCNDTLSVGVCGNTPWSPLECKDGLHPWVPYYCPKTCGNTCAPMKCPANFTFIDGSSIGNDTFTGSCYRALFQPLTQAQAATNCSNMVKGKSRLVYIEDPYELDAIVNFVANALPDQQGKGATWIGGCRKNYTNDDPLSSFVWSPSCTPGTGPSGGSKPFLFHNWNAGEPTNANKDETGKTKTMGEWCVEMFVNGSVPIPLPPGSPLSVLSITSQAIWTVWNDVDCNAVRGFYICETEPSCI